MLKNDALQQLSQLKESIRAQKDFAEGEVRGTQGRFGFVTLDDGREAFLAPDIMQRVFPGDRVEVSLKKNEKDKLDAELETLISTDLKQFTGQYMVRGQGHFVVPDSPQFNRWIFVPPKSRKSCKDGDYVQARIIRHPFSYDGKAQAKIEQRIGHKDDSGIEHRYIIAKHELFTRWPKPSQEQAETIQKTPDATESGKDLIHLPFVTIDSAKTQDMDDALYAERTESGWDLYTAIADPTRLITQDSPIAKTARQRSQTVYLAGQTLTMLPEQLSHDTFSLVADQNRSTIVCHMNISEQGEVTGFNFYRAVIRSHGKLSYDQVTAQLAETAETEASAETAHSAGHQQLEQLKNLQKCCGLLNRYRAEHALLMDENPDFELILNDTQHIERIEKQVRTAAHRIVEEAMLATNCCAGAFLSEHSAGIFSTHAGFREERLKDVNTLIQESKLELNLENLAEFDQYKTLIRHLQQNADHTQLLSTLKRMLQPSSLTLTPAQHFGLGFERYATVTSPIRRFQDFYNHAVLCAILDGQTAPVLTEEQLGELKEQITKGRQACRQLEQWLIALFVSQSMLPKKGGGKKPKNNPLYRGKIVLLNSQGIGVKLQDTGIEGFIQLNKKEQGNKLSFDQNRLILKARGIRYQLDQEIDVQISDVDMNRWQVKFSLPTDNTSDKNTPQKDTQEKAAEKADSTTVSAD